MRPLNPHNLSQGMLGSRQRRLGINPTPDGTKQMRKTMADYRNIQARTPAGVRVDAGIDQGLRSYMLQVYNLMGIGLAVTGFAALAIVYLATTNDASLAAAQLPNGKMLTNLGVALYGSPLRWVVMLAPLAAVFFLSFRIEKMSVAAAQTTFWVYAALVGVSLSSIFLVYTTGSIVQTFFITAASFGALSLYGYTTKRDLSGMGSFLFMGLIGIILASLVNIFLASSALQFAISAIGVLVFAGLTAYDTQNIKEMYYEGDAADTYGRKAIMGALRLYLDFINMFMFLLQFLGNRE
jgi:FtsH-binding integral membrane protein